MSNTAIEKHEKQETQQANEKTQLRAYPNIPAHLSVMKAQTKWSCAR
jgi:hypothetical protein